MMKNKVYLFLYNPCIWESALSTISIHYTLKSAYDAMRKHKLESYNEWYDNRIRWGKGFRDKFGEDEYWTIKSQEILN